MHDLDILDLSVPRYERMDHNSFNHDSHSNDSFDSGSDYSSQVCLLSLSLLDCLFRCLNKELITSAVCAIVLGLFNSVRSSLFT